MIVMRKKLFSLLTQAMTASLLLAGVSTVVAQDADDGMLIEEVVVTARKMSENIQDVPLAITVVSSDLIDQLGLRDLSDIAKVTPGLVFDSDTGRGANRPVIRGQANILGDSGVSYFIDGVYISGSIDDYDINDVERMEVVKGPQSALYGRNTYSGAINIITKSPSQEMGGRVMVKYAEDDEVEVSASLRGRMTDNLSGGITARYYDLGGPFTNTWDGSDIGEQESTSVSGVLKYENNGWDIRGRAYLGRTEDGQVPRFATLAVDNNCFQDNGSIYAGRGRYYCGVIEPQPINTDWPRQAPNATNEIDTKQFSLSIDYEISEMLSFTSITGYNEQDTKLIQDGDYLPTSFQVSNFTPGGFPFAGFEDGPPWLYGYVGDMTDFTFANTGNSKDWSQEIRFTFTGERVSGLFGGYYFDQSRETRDIRVLPPGAADIAGANWFSEFLKETANCAANFFCESMTPFFGPGVTVPRDVNERDIRNIAAFGMISFDISDAFGLTLEGRYQEEKVTQVATVQDLGGPVESVTTATKTFKSFSPRATVEWRVADNSMLYALYAEGTKPGGFNGTVAIEAGTPTYDEEDVKSFEVGFKNVWANGQVIANFAAYMNKIEGYQLTQNVISGVNSTSAVVNAGDADVNGLEVEFMFRPAGAEGLTLTFNYAWNDSEFTEGRDQNEGVLNDAADDGLVNCSTGYEFPEIEGNCSTTSNPPVFGSIVGKQIPRTAEHQAYFDIDFRRPLNRGSWEWFVGANYSYESSKFAQVHNYAETGSAQLVNARLGVANDNWNITAFGRNLTGEDASAGIIRYAEPSAFVRNFASNLRRDTYFGLQAAYSF